MVQFIRLGRSDGLDGIPMCVFAMGAVVTSNRRLPIRLPKPIDRSTDRLIDPSIQPLLHPV